MKYAVYREISQPRKKDDINRSHEYINAPIFNGGQHMLESTFTTYSPQSNSSPHPHCMQGDYTLELNQQNHVFITHPTQLLFLGHLTQPKLFRQLEPKPKIYPIQLKPFCGNGHPVYEFVNSSCKTISS